MTRRTHKILGRNARNKGSKLPSLRAGIVRKAMSYIAEEMGVALKKSAVSPNIRERLDLSCAILGPNGEVLAQAEHIPVHLGSLSWAAKRLIEVVDDLVDEPGDVVIVNNPYLTGTHLNDVTVITKTEVGWLVNKAHHVDVGGPVAGSLNPYAKTLYDEGYVIEPTLIAKKWKPLDNMISYIASHIRNEKVFKADLKAQLASLKLGHSRIIEAIQRYGDLLSYADEYLEASKREYLEALKGKEGEGEAEVKMELPEGYAKIKVKIEIKEGLFVDFTGTSRQVPYNLNAVEGVAYAAASFFFKSMFLPEGPVDQGLYDLVKIKTEEGSLLNPKFPAAVGAGNLETSQRVLWALLKASSFLNTPSAGPGTMSNVVIAYGKKVYYETNGGGGSATSQKDGSNAVQWGMTNTMNTPIEIVESELPILFLEYSVRRGSGGRGNKKGGDGIVRKWKALKDVQVSLIVSQTIEPSPGNPPGKPAKIMINGKEVSGYFSGIIKEGGTLELLTPGAGGHS